MKKVYSEYLSHLPNIFFLIIGTTCLVSSIWLDPANFFRSSWVLLIPIVLSPFYEWILHKFVLHCIVGPEHKFQYNYMLKLHYEHHWNPTDLKVVFAPFSGGLSIFLTFGPLGYLVFGDLAMSLLFLSGVVFYFCFYEWIHLAHHVPSYRPITSYGKLIRNAHTWHHYKNENFWWGVTNPLGDFLMGTFKDPKEVEFSPSAKTLGDLQKSPRK